MHSELLFYPDPCLKQYNNVKSFVNEINQEEEK